VRSNFPQVARPEFAIFEAKNVLTSEALLQVPLHGNLLQGLKNNLPFLLMVNCFWNIVFMLLDTRFASGLNLYMDCSSLIQNMVKNKLKIKQFIFLQDRTR